MAVREFRLVFLLVFVFLLSGDLLSVEARTSNKKPGVCPKHEDGTEWCGESPDGIYASVHRTSAQEESGTPVKSDNEKRTSTDIKPSSAGTDQSEGTVREHGSPAGLASGKSDGGEQGETNSAESHSREDVHTETAGMGQSADRETAGTASEDKEPEPELRVPFVSGVKVFNTRGICRNHVAALVRSRTRDWLTKQPAKQATNDPNAKNTSAATHGEHIRIEVSKSYTTDGGSSYLLWGYRGKLKLFPLGRANHQESDVGGVANAPYAQCPGPLNSYNIPSPYPFRYQFRVDQRYWDEVRMTVPPVSCQTVLPIQANSTSQVLNLDGSGYRLATHLIRVGLSWLEFDQAQIVAHSNSSQVFLRLANSSQVVLLLLGDCVVIVRHLNGFLVSWLDLAAPFGRPPMQVLIL